jgi:serine protease Do
VRIQDVTDDVARDLGLAAAKGALVASVEAAGPAETGGIAAGDVILSVDGRSVDAMNTLPRMVADMAVGKEVTVIVMRDGKEETLNVTLGRLEEAERATEVAAAADPADEDAEEAPEAPVIVVGPLGLTLADLSPETRDLYGIKPGVASGVVVTAVQEGSAAHDRRMTPGDVIVEIGQERVANPADFDERLAAMREEGRANVKLVVQNKDGHVRWVNLPLDAE